MNCAYLKLSHEIGNFGINLANCNVGNEPQAPASLLNPMPIFSDVENVTYNLVSCNYSIIAGILGGCFVSRNWDDREQSLLLNKDGNVGIGTTAPTETLTVVGTANITSTLYKGTSAYNNPDIAEKMSSREKLEFGDVVSADKENALHVRKSKAAYDKAVIGVASEAPTMVIGNINGTGGTEIAVVGRVRAKVNDNNGNIGIGDLLTTSNEEGYAMKCDEMEKCRGAIIGKAFEPLSGKKGRIWMLIALQ